MFVESFWSTHPYRIIAYNSHVYYSPTSDDSDELSGQRSWPYWTWKTPPAYEARAAQWPSVIGDVQRVLSFLRWALQQVASCWLEAGQDLVCSWKFFVGTTVFLALGQERRENLDVGSHRCAYGRGGSERCRWKCALGVISLDGFVPVPSNCQWFLVWPFTYSHCHFKSSIC